MESAKKQAVLSFSFNTNDFLCNEGYGLFSIDKEIYTEMFLKISDKQYGVELIKIREAIDSADDIVIRNLKLLKEKNSILEKINEILKNVNSDKLSENYRQHLIKIKKLSNDLYKNGNSKVLNIEESLSKINEIIKLLENLGNYLEQISSFNGKINKYLDEEKIFYMYIGESEFLFELLDNTKDKLWGDRNYNFNELEKIINVVLKNIKNNIAELEKNK